MGTVLDRRVRHIPVLVREVIELLRCRPGGNYVDCTVGEGGHAEEILKASGPDGRLIGIDRDFGSIEQSRCRLAVFGDRVSLHHEDFIRMDLVLKKEGIQNVDGILFDLGLASGQLEDGQRGFSFLKEGPLDMRMDQTAGQTASDLVNTLDEAELTRIFQEYGEERWAGRISRMIVRRRAERPIHTTADLSGLVLLAIPRRYHGHRIHPATRIFQALRIAVNHELSELWLAMEASVRRLTSGGRLCIISYHSLEDRIVKHGFRDWGKESQVKVITRRPLVASVTERSFNPRSRSAKLRVAERC
ncbi:MAG: 16S rRNA (cytosine(1402)-N(4))-methyltransferase RsmH [Nitrospiria bacterium]